MCICCALPTWWSWRGGCTRSHSEHGRETPQRRWYFVSRRGRVGRCQVCKAQHISSQNYETWNKPRVAIAARFCFYALRQSSRPVEGLEQPLPSRRGQRPRGPANKKTGHARKLKTYRGVEQPPPTRRGDSLEDRQTKNRACPEAQTLSRGGAAR